jgi:threonine dehydrogenase-like Zn-dependent dehydrogenase
MFSDKLIPFDPTLLYQKEPFIISSKGSLEAKREAIQLLEKRSLQILPMITHRFPLEETVQAFKTFEDKIPDALRIIIENNS